MDGEEGSGDRPHPLGPRDVIEALAPWSRTIVTGVIVVAVAVGAYLLGASRERLTILDTPRAETGVLWLCDQHLTGVIRGPAGPATIISGKTRIETNAGQGGTIDVSVGPGRMPDRVWVVTAGGRISVPVLDCVPVTKAP